MKQSGIQVPLACLFTDFGEAGPYMGLMEAALIRHCPDARVIRLMSDAPAFAPDAAGRLLLALVPWLPDGCALVGVVDPGVGGARRPLLLEADGRAYVGPDNGVFAAVARRADKLRVWRLETRPFRLSASFHGRDLFAPAAGAWLAGHPPLAEPVEPQTLEGWDRPLVRQEVIYIDHYGNAVTDIPGDAVALDVELEVAGRRLERARTFSDVAPGAAFWYVDSLNRVEIAVNRGSAARLLGLDVGSPVVLV